jgi:selenocysteine lyase/cysteine desulfurase
VIADPALLAQLTPQKLAPASDEVPERFERGTPAFEQLAGVAAAVNWIAGLTDASGTRRARVLAAMAAVERHLDELATSAREGLEQIDGVRVLGRAARRTSTISFTVDGIAPAAVSAALSDRGINVWDGDNYAYELMDRFGLADSGGAIRASLVLYNDESDVRRLVDAVAELAA